VSIVSAIRDAAREEYEVLSRHIFYAITSGREKEIFAFQAVVSSSPSESSSMT
jgi:hypothetical protein